MLKEDELEHIFVKLHRIIPFSNVEGQGNRCSIFLQGCNINCLYCHNPETIKMDDKDARIVNLRYILDEIKKSMPFIRGITVSGGEPTLHYKVLIPLFKEVKKLGLTCYLDSNGFFDFDKIKSLIDVTDKFLFDVKGMGEGLNRLCFDFKNVKAVKTEYPLKPLKYDNNLNNLKLLLRLNKVEEIRLVHINNFYDAKKLIEKIAELIKDYPDVILKLIRVHSKGARSYETIENNKPSLRQHQELENYAFELGIKKVILIN